MKVAHLVEGEWDNDRVRGRRLLKKRLESLVHQFEIKYKAASAIEHDLNPNMPEANTGNAHLFPIVGSDSPLYNEFNSTLTRIFKTKHPELLNMLADIRELKKRIENEGK